MPPAGQPGADGAALGRKFNGVGNNVEHRAFQLFCIHQAVDSFGVALVGKLDAGVLHQRRSLGENLFQQSADVPGFLAAGGIGAVAAGVGHVADDPEHLEKAPVDSGDLLPGGGVILQAGDGE